MSSTAIPAAMANLAMPAAGMWVKCKQYAQSEHKESTFGVMVQCASLARCY